MCWLLPLRFHLLGSILQLIFCSKGDDLVGGCVYHADLAADEQDFVAKSFASDDG